MSAFTMQKAIWTSFGIALVLVNVIAEVGEYYTGIHVHMLLRIALIVGVTIGAWVLAGATILVSKMDEEVPLSGHVKDTLGADRRKAD
ncbi:MAG: hypothetical protein Ct9H300mP22_7030 [Gammaproteobacteria bacterium]|nr:MAG: hypothetical protein Ct9H300mP22_7030 [Gammaproteobacteria bacterium]